MNTWIGQKDPGNRQVVKRTESMQVLGVRALCLAFRNQWVNNCWGSVTIAKTTCMEKLRMQSGYGFMGVEEVRQSFGSFNMDTG